MSKRDREWGRRLSAWFDGEAGELDAEEVRQHLMEEPEARAQLQEYRRLREDLVLLQPEEPSPERVERMRLRFLDGAAREARGTERALRWWNAAAAALLALGLGWFLLDAAGPVRPAATHASEPNEVDRAIQELLARPPAQEAGERP